MYHNVGVAIEIHFNRIIHHSNTRKSLNGYCMHDVILVSSKYVLEFV